MTIAEEILKLKNNLAASYAACEEKGGDLPEEKNFDNLPACIGSLATTENTQTFVIPTTEEQILTPPEGHAGYNTVTIAAVTSAIDENIVPNKILEGVTILGVEGSVIAASNTSLNAVPRTVAQSFTIAEPYTGYDIVNISAVTSAIDSNIKASNIKANTTILGVEGTVIELKGQDKTVTPLTTDQTIVPDETFNGLLTVKVKGVTSAIDSDITANNIRSGVNILGVTGTVVELNTTTLNVTPTTYAQHHVPASPYNGYRSVHVAGVTSAIDSNITAANIRNGVTILGVTGTVEQVNTTTLSITPTTENQNFLPQSPHNGFDSVSVAAVTSSIDSSINPANIKDGAVILGVAGTVIESNTQSITITTNGTYTPDSNHTGFDNVKVDINTVSNEDLTVTPTTTEQNFTPAAGKTGFGSVKVHGVTSAIDSDIAANNIRSGVNILGVTGTVVELKGEAKTISPSTSYQTILPSSGHNGITSIRVNPVTAAIDSNITASNIKSGTTILGVHGTVVELKGETKTVSPATTTVTVTPSTGYNGLTNVKVNPVTSSIDSNITANNIRAGVTILGVEGTVTELIGESITLTANGTYTPATGNGFTNVNVAVSGNVPTLISQTFTANGTYAATSYNADGFSSVHIDVVPTGTYTVTTNGTYNIENYASVKVDVDNGATLYKSYLDAIKAVLVNQGITVSDDYSELSTIVDNSYTEILNQLNDISGNA